MEKLADNDPMKGMYDRYVESEDFDYLSSVIKALVHITGVTEEEYTDWAIDHGYGSADAMQKMFARPNNPTAYSDDIDE